ncbi:hypothetical protein [Pseudalkalibacillus caeni]|uniref:Uncharacterized protein n=1 Tax=Exobacillus caeni TaxID=2574798 RepID=A0A5R9F140_9BACL|nr:hypothetical protein [Pseudalkalibacillus caeni]TLS37277.1 hypothetical protein FCL54_12200 [Pseudalkalibacillus caeni]
MKNFFIMILLLTLLLPAKSGSAQSLASLVNCPDSEELIIPSKNQKKMLLTALPAIVPMVYQDTAQQRWQIVSVSPIKKGSFTYKTASKLCGKAVTEYSWIVKINFPSSSSHLTQRQLLIVRSNNSGWLVWHHN